MSEIKEYVPYGPEWKRAMMNFTKDRLIDMLALALKAKKPLEEERNQLRQSILIYQEADIKAPLECSILTNDEQAFVNLTMRKEPTV